MSSKIIRNYIPALSGLIFDKSKPSMVSVNLTQQCNQRCIYCEIGQDKPSTAKETLSLSDIKWILDEMAANSIKKISLCGGEPFLFDGIIDAIDYAGKKNIRCSITTNGMTAHMLNETELNVLKECNCEINISVDSLQESIQAFTRGNSLALQNALKSIQKLTEWNIPVTVLTVISKYNYHDLYTFITEAYKKGIKQVLFQPVIYYSNYPERIVVDKKSQLNVSINDIDILMEELKKILHFEKKHRINTNVYRIFPWIRYYLKTATTQDGKWFFNTVLAKFFCRDVFAIIDISFNGGIQPCCLSLASISIINNRQAGLMELWNKATEKIKIDLLSGRYYECCNGCCNHFSRNMIASIIKYPLKNRSALITIMPLLLSRLRSRILKKLYL